MATREFRLKQEHEKILAAVNVGQLLKSIQMMKKDEEEAYEEPKKSRKVRKTTETIPVITQNSFEPLMDQDNVDTANEEPAATANEENTDKDEQNYKPTPIYVKHTDRWLEISKKIKEENIITNSCKLVNNSVQIRPATDESYKSLKQLLRAEKVQFYSFQHRSEKTIKAVIRGVPQDLTEEDIRTDLHGKGYPAIKVKRMSGRDGKPAPLVFIELTQNYKSIFDLKNCCGLAVIVEVKKKRNGIIQCHRCQMFGHIQRNCDVNHRCMKCGGDHSTHLCDKPRTTPPKCANCGGEHLSTWLLCKRNPNNPKKREEKFVKAEPPKINAWTKRMEEREEKQKKQQQQQKTPENREELATILGRMLITLNQTNATLQQKMEFLEQTQQITRLFNH